MPSLVVVPAALFSLIPPARLIVNLGTPAAEAVKMSNVVFELFTIKELLSANERPELSAEAVKETLEAIPPIGELVRVYELPLKIKDVRLVVLPRDMLRAFVVPIDILEPVCVVSLPESRVSEPPVQSLHSSMLIQALQQPVFLPEHQGHLS